MIGISWLGLVFLASELTLAWRRRAAREPKASDRDDGSLALLWRVIGCAMTVGITLAAFNVGPAFSRGVRWDWICYVVFAVGTAIRWWAISHLGRFFTVDVAVAADHRVVDDGPYRLVRHPSYTGLMLQFAAFAVASAHYLSLVIVLLPIGWAIHRRIRVEERALSDKLGVAYARYVHGTKRLVPWIY